MAAPGGQTEQDNQRQDQSDPSRSPSPSTFAALCFRTHSTQPCIEHLLVCFILLPQVFRRASVRTVLTSHVPLFPGYLFLLGNDRQRIAALEARVHSLPVADQESLWQELGQIHQLIESGAPVTPEERLGPGQAVEICSGPLAGMRGTVVRAAAGRRFVVRVDFIQRGASVELDDYTMVCARD